MIYKLREEYFDLKKLELVSEIYEDYDFKTINGKSTKIHNGYYFEYQVNGRIYHTLPVLPRIQIDELRSELIRIWRISKGKK